jgi:hypothetical protein
MADDFCIIHGYEHMKSQMGNPIPFCQACEDSMTKEPWEKELAKHDEYIVTADYSNLRPGATAMEPTPVLAKISRPDDGALQSAREALRQAQDSLMAASIAACDCNTKTNNPAYHSGHCRWLKLITAMDSLDSVAEYLA